MFCNRPFPTLSKVLDTKVLTRVVKINQLLGIRESGISHRNELLLKSFMDGEKDGHYFPTDHNFVWG